MDTDDDCEDIEVQRPDLSLEQDNPQLLMKLALQRLDTITDDEGFMYCVNRSLANVRYLRCTKFKNGCTGRAIMREDKVEQTSPHNHQADRRRVAVRQFIKQFILEAQDQRGRTLRQIYDQLCHKCPEEAMYMSYKAAYRSLRRASLKMAQLPPTVPFGGSEDMSPGEMVIKDEAEEAEIKEELISDNEGSGPVGVSELLPGPKGQPLYYDGVGYYFSVTNADSAQRWLQCSHPSCGMFGFMELWDGAPITLLEGGEHSHPPNTQRRQRICFLHCVKTRHSREPSTPFATIFQEEADKNPIGASFFSLETIEEYLNKKRNQIQLEYRLTGDDRSAAEEPEPKRRRLADLPDRPTVEVKQEVSTPASTPTKRSARLPGPEYFTDLRGHYYRCTRIDAGVRCLRCLVPTCPAEARMAVSDNAEILALPSSRPHNHQPDTSTDVSAKISQMEAVWPEQSASERLPSLRLQYCCYHDGHGYYYHQTSQVDNIRYLACMESSCGARAHMCTLKDAPISLSPLQPGHCHPPDPTLRDALLFVDAVRVRARSDSCPAIAIELETARNVQGAQRVDLTLLQQCLERAYQVSKSSSNEELTEDEVDFAGCLKPAGHKQETDQSPVGVSQCENRYSGSHLVSEVCCLQVDFAGCLKPADQSQDTDQDQDPVGDGGLESASETVVGPYRPIYHNGNGHYFTETFCTHTHRYLICEKPDCLAQAQMVPVEGAPITRLAGSVHHSHPPDPWRLSALHLLVSLRDRVRDQPDTPLHTIYDQLVDTAREPIISAQLNKDNTLKMMSVVRLAKTKGTEQTISQDKFENHIEEEGLWDGTEPAQRWPCARHQTWLIHDRRGYYYHSQFTHQREWLMCCEEGCSARAWLDLVPQAVVRRAPGCVLHNHLPDLNHRVKCDKSGEERTDTRADDQYFKDFCVGDSLDTKATIEPCEVLHSADSVSGEPVYSDGRGFYFNTQHEKSVLASCVMPVCRARAFLLAQLSQILAPPPSAHSHPPDPLLRHRLVFMHNLRSRTLSQASHDIAAIYTEEADREPIGAAMLDEAAVKNLMYKVAKSKYIQELPVDSIESHWIRDSHNDGFTAEEFAGDPVGSTGSHQITDVTHLSDDDWVSGLASEHMPFNDETSSVPSRSEKLPSRSNNVVYHDGAGYYFHFNTTKERNMYLRCAEPRCKVRAWKPVSPEDAPILLTRDSPVHNHRPDLTRRRQLLFIHRCKLRAATEALPLQDIWQSEAQRDPETAALVSESNVKTQMKRYRQEHSSEVEIDIHRGEVPEKIPSVSNEILWHAAGYFYTIYHIVGHLYKAKCIEKGCSARSQIQRVPGQMASIRLNRNTSHNHPAVGGRRAQLLFINRCKHRAAQSFETIHQIYSEEAARDPEVAKVLSSARVKQAMLGAKRDYMKKFNCQIKDVIGENCDLDESEASSETAHKGAQSECLLSQEDGLLMFHDLQGYLYRETSVQLDNRLLKCVDCEVQAQMATHPLDAAIVLLDPAAHHNHEPDMSRMGLIVRHLSLDGLTEEKPPPDLTDVVYAACNYTPTLKTADSVASADQGYTDYVTLEAEDGDCQEDPDDPDFTPLGEGNKRLYHDGNGYHYSLHKHRNRRFLQCSMAQCGVVVALDPQDKPLAKLFSTCAKHPHPPDQSHRRRNLFLKKAAHRDDPSDSVKTPGVLELPDVDEEDVEKLPLPSEMMPGLRPNSTVYHDGRGYYFIFNAFKNNKRYVRCIEPKCRVRGSMEPVDRAPINVSPGSIHNHRPDFRRKNYVLFLQRCKERAAAETKPVQEIYNEEVASDPVSAAMISHHNLMQRMLRTRKLNFTYIPTKQDQSEFAEACNSGDLDDDGSCSQDEAADVTEEDNNGAEEDMETEAIEKAISQLANSSADTSTEVGEERVAMASEVLPGIRPHSVMYYDGRGYYYIFNSQRENIWYLKCIEPQCRVRAHMAPSEGSPIELSAHSLHNHRPDYKRKKFVLWMEETKQRAVSETLPITAIYAQQVARDPVSASLIFKENMKTRMYRARKASLLHDQSTTHVKVVEEQREQEGESDTVCLYQPNSRPSFCDDKGYCYQQTTIRNQVRYLKCLQPGCKARASTTLDPHSTAINRLMPAHNHDPNTVTLDADSHLQLIYTDGDEGEQIELELQPASPAKRPYRQRQKPELTIDPEEIVDSSATAAFSTNSDVDIAAGDYYHNEDQQRFPLKPSEVIPGLRPDANNYHDGNGFYYELNRLSQNIRYLKCLIKDCKARAYMEVGKQNAPIIQTNFARHNHGPDLFRKQFTVFLHRVTRRAANEDTPINVIYDQEAARDPQSANQIRMENVKQRMLRFRKKHRQQRNAFHKVQVNSEDLTMYQVEDGSEDLDDGLYYIVEEGDGDTSSHYEGYVVSEVEIESSTQLQP